MAESTPADGADLVRFTRAVTEAGSLDELGRVFAAGFGRLAGVPMYGFYSLEPDAPRIEHNVAVNVSDVFVARYERAMDVDPLLSRSLESRRPVYNLDLMAEAAWEESPIYRSAYATHAMRHVAEAPIVAQGKVVGALHFAASAHARRFTAADLRLAEWVAGLLALSIVRIRTQRRAERELDQVRAALELAGTAVVISELDAPDLRLNVAAGRLLEEVCDAEDRVHDLLIRPAAGGGRHSRRVGVELSGGAPGVLHAHSDRTAAGELVTVLELRREDPRLERRLLEVLTVREGQVATLVVDGLSDREIADRLGLSPYTVSQHVKALYRKLGVDSRVGLTRLLLGAPPVRR